LAISNVLGSNIANILLILGITALIYPLQVKRNTTWKEIPFSLLAVIMLGVFVNDIWIDGGGFSVVSRIDAIALIAFFIIFMYYTFGISKVEGDGDHSYQVRSMPVSLAMIGGGILGLTVGGDWVVRGATAFATYFGISQALVGLTIVAIGNFSYCCKKEKF
jgi:cation:H+ antiporter